LTPWPTPPEPAPPINAEALVDCFLAPADDEPDPFDGPPDTLEAEPGLYDEPPPATDDDARDLAPDPSAIGRPPIYRGLAQWRADNSNAPTVKPITGDASQHRLGRPPVSPGRVARAERQLMAGVEPDDVADTNGLRLGVVDLIAKRVAIAQAEAAQRTASPRDTSKARARQRIENDIQELGIGEGHQVLLSVAEALHRARMFLDSHAAASLAVVLLLRIRVMQILGRHETPLTDPKHLLTKLRAYGAMTREDFQQATQLCRHYPPRPKHMPKRSQSMLALARMLPELLPDPVERPRTKEEARRFYTPRTMPAAVARSAVV